MDRRQFGRVSFFTVLSSGLACLAGCGGEARQTGTVVQTPAEDLKSMEASSAAYKAMRKEKRSKEVNR